MSANPLVFNDDNSHLIVFTRRPDNHKRETVLVKAGDHVIRPSYSEKLLGCHIAQDMKWKEHLQDNKGSLLHQLNGRLRGLSRVAKHSPSHIRLMVARGIYLSKLTYLIQVWGGTQEYLIKALQVNQNKAMKIATGLSWYTPTGVLLRKCNWLSVRQLIAYHIALTVHKTVTSGNPQYIWDKMSTETYHITRQQVKFSQNFTGKSVRTQGTFCYRGAIWYNRWNFWQAPS